MNPLLLIPAALSAFAALKGSSAAKKSANAQKSIADKQAALYNQALPSYQDTINALRQNAGFAPLDYNATQTSQQPVGGLLGRAGVTHTVTTNNPQPLYNNVTDNQLGPYNNPADRLRLLGAEENINRGLTGRQNQLSFSLGRRGLTGSNYDVAGRAALMSQAEQQRGAFARNLAINAGQEQERRLQLLLNALNPGLGSGPAASNAYGQIGEANAAGAANISQNLGGAAQQYALLQGLQNNGGGGVQGQYSFTNPQTGYNSPQYSPAGIGYGNPEAFTPNPSYGFQAPGLPNANGPVQPGDPNFDPWKSFGAS